jgi:hypothetical protein
MRILLALLATAALAGPALAQQPGVPVPGAAQAQPGAAGAAAPTAVAERAGPADIRVNQLIIYGDDPCPESTDPNEVTVCARLPDGDRYRVPSNLRDNPNEPGSNSWANRATELSYVGRTGTDSCSTVGGGGFTGCFNQIVNQARAERRAAGDVNWTRMVEEARQRRNTQIEENAQAAEEQAQRDEAARQTPNPTP